MTALFIATPKVRHLAVWTPDSPAAPAIGSSRAICGTPIWIGTALQFNARDLDIDRAFWTPEWVRRMDTAMRRPVCKRCTATLTALNNLNERTP